MSGPYFDRCESCPVPAEGPLCHAREVGHRRFCRGIAEGGKIGDGFRDWVVSRTNGTPMPAKAPENRLPEPAPPALVPLAESIRITRAIRECPYRTAPSCGCPGVAGTCSRADRPFGGKPFYTDCQACVAKG